MDDNAWFGVVNANLHAANFLVLEMLPKLPPEEAWPLLIEHKRKEHELTSQGV